MNREDVLSYAKAAIDVAEFWSLNGSRNVVIPSRGSVPVHRIAQSIREYHNVRTSHDVLTLPFTADDSVLPTKDTRFHWSKVLEALCTGKSNPHYEFYKRMGETLGGVGMKLLNLGPIYFIDTAISGKAATEISESMDECGIDYHMILLAENLKQPYKHHLEMLEHRGKATLIPINNLYTEDQNPFVLGNGTVMIPSMSTETMVASYPFELSHVTLNYFLDEINSPGKFCSGMSTLHFYASQILQSGLYQEEFDELLPKVNQAFPRFSSKDLTKDLAKKFGNTSVTSSHVIKLEERVS